jgi:hypothetical protein
VTNRLERLDCSIGHSTLVRIEKGASHVETAAELIPLRDLLALSVALETSPVHLIAPLEDESEVAITPHQVLPARAVRAWTRGAAAPPGADPLMFLVGLPEHEQREFLERLRTRGMDEETKALHAEARESAIDATIDGLRQLDRRHDSGRNRAAKGR